MRKVKSPWVAKPGKHSEGQKDKFFAKAVDSVSKPKSIFRQKKG